MAKNLTAAKQLRDKFWAEFKSACVDLEEELEPPGTGKPNQRRLKVKMGLVDDTHDKCLTALSQVWNLEKTSPTDETNWNWVNTNLRKPKNAVVNKAQELLITLDVKESPEEKAKATATDAKRKAKIELVSFEAELKAEVEGLTQVVGDTNIWLKDSHYALTKNADTIHEGLTKQHMVMGNKYLELLGEVDQSEEDRQEKFRSELRPNLAEVRAKLLGKTPAGTGPGPGPAQIPAAQQAPGAVAGQGVQVVQNQPHRSKFKMAALPHPKISGKVIDYPEWKKLFRECVESQYEESATIMILRTQSLPDSLINLVPRCAGLAVVWEKLDKKFLDSARVWKGVKADLKSLSRAKLGNGLYMMTLVSKLLDAESLLDTVGMVHWLRQEDKIPEYEDLLTETEKLEWVKMKPGLTGTPWENFKTFLMRMRDWYEEIAKTGTGDQESEDKGKDVCGYCKKRGHTEEYCRLKKSVGAGGGKDRKTKSCFKCGSEEHLARDCPERVDQSNNKVKKGDAKNRNTSQDSFSNYLRTNDCKWCNRTYNTAFTCSGCGKKWGAKSKAEHCLAHCVEFTAASAKEKGDMVIKGQNCLICLHHEHDTSSCFGKDQQRTICGLGGCQKRHHPALHSAPHGTVQAVQSAAHLSAGTGDGETTPGVGDESSGNSLLQTAVLAKTGPQGKFLSKVVTKRVQTNRISWTDPCWTGSTQVRIAEQRAKELEEIKELLKLPAVEGGNVLLLIQTVMVKYGPVGELTEISVFWDNGSTCSLVLTETAEMLSCPGEPVTVSIETVNGVITRNTKLYCVELINNSGDRICVKAFGVENVLEVRSIVQLAGVKNKFSDEVQTQWGKLSKRPTGTVHLLVGQEHAGLHPAQYETHNNLVVCRSMFGSGWVLIGYDENLQAEECSWGEEVAAMSAGRVIVVDQSNNRITVNQVKLTYTQERDFFTLDDLGIEPARRCPGCRGCKECSWRGQKLSRQEAFELDYIEKCVEFKNGRFRVRFPFLVDPCELADNYGQVVRIAESEERKLEREGRMTDFNELFQKLQDLGALEEISDKELVEWRGPVHYVSLQHVINEDSATTSFRIVSNSSLATPGNPHTLNSILATGPNILTDPYKVMVRFRTYLRGLTSDVTKAYYQMFTGLVEKHVRRIVWRYGVRGAKWRIFGYLCVSFGDACAAALLEICFRLVIVLFGAIDEIAAKRLKTDHFVDDITSGGDDMQVQRFKGKEDPDTLLCDGTMPQMFGKVNWILKAIALSGEKDGAALQKLSSSVLGHGYSTERDILTVKFRVNISPRKRRMPTGPDLSVETLGRLDQTILTRRLVLGVTSGQFDMLGMASPLLIKLRVSMRDLFVKEVELSWDTALPAKLRNTWVDYIRELVITGQLEFQRCVRPVGKVEEFILVVFFDASDHAYAAVIYCRWRMEDGAVVVKLLCSKARTTPLRGLSTPRGELNGAVVGVRLVWTVVQALEFEELPARILFGGDSETVLAAREKACGALGEYFGNRIGECWDLQEKITELVPVGVEGQGEWYHMPSKYNCADRPTRLDSKPEDLVIGSVWQDGQPYLRLPFSDWPWERKFADKKVVDVVPKEELTARYRGIAAATTAVQLEGNEILEEFDNGYNTNDYDVLINKTEPLFRWQARCRARLAPELLTLTSRDMAIRFWFKAAMPATRQAAKAGRLRELTMVEEQGMLVIKGRARSGMRELFGADFLPVLMAGERVAVLIMLKSHADCDHKSVDITLSTSRHHCWIVGGRKLAKTICKLCVSCKYLKKKKETQKMASLPEELCVPCPAFSHVGVDLTGPFKVFSMLKKRSTRRSEGSLKVWAVLVLCLNTSALKIYLVPGYSTQDFQVAWVEFESDCEIRKKVHSDRGSQLVSAAEDIDTPDYNWDMIGTSRKGQTVWNFCPAGAQWRNGAVEAQVKQFKKSLELYKQSGMTYAELQSAFKKIAAVLNSRPVSARYGPRHEQSDPDYLELVTPSMLLTGRSGVDLPIREYADESSPGQRLAYKEELEKCWWERWKVQCFDSLIPTTTWTHEKRSVVVGDVVLISYPDKSKTGTYRLGVVDSVEIDPDGLVRTCQVRYRLVRSDLPAKELRIYFKGLKFKNIRVPVQRLCVLLAVEDQGQPTFLMKCATDEKTSELMNMSDTGDAVIKDNIGGEATERADTADDIDDNIGGEATEKADAAYDTPEDFDEVELGDAAQVSARNMLVQSFRTSVVKKKKVQVTNRSMKILHRKFTMFEKLFDEEKVEIF